MVRFFATAAAFAVVLATFVDPAACDPSVLSNINRAKSIGDSPHTHSRKMRKMASTSINPSRSRGPIRRASASVESSTEVTPRNSKLKNVGKFSTNTNNQNRRRDLHQKNKLTNPQKNKESTKNMKLPITPSLKGRDLSKPDTSNDYVNKVLRMANFRVTTGGHQGQEDESSNMLSNGDKIATESSSHPTKTKTDRSSSTPWKRPTSKRSLVTSSFARARKLDHNERSGKQSSRRHIADKLSAGGTFLEVKKQQDTSFSSTAFEKAVRQASRKMELKKTEGSTRHRAAKSLEEERKLQGGAGLDACTLAAAQEMEDGENEGVFCVCDPRDDQTTLYCQELLCKYCNAEGTACGSTDFGSFFDNNGVEIGLFEQLQYLEGRSDFVSFSFDSATSECSVSVNDLECSSCVLGPCNDDGESEESEDGSGDVDWQVDCSNLPEPDTFLGCDESFTTDGVLELLNDGEFETCLPIYSSQNGQEACLEVADELSFEYDCVCTEDPSGSGGYSLDCTDSCLYCNEAGTVCGQESFSEYFEASGDSTAESSEFTYLTGQVGSVHYQESNCNLDFECTECSAHVDSTMCSSCAMQTCVDEYGDSYTVPLIDCTNVEGAGVYDLCDESLGNLAGDPFHFFTDDGFFSCFNSGRLECERQEAEKEAESESSICTCFDGFEDLPAILSCTSNCGVYCNDEGDVCGKKSSTVSFSEFGDVEYETEEFQYTIGREETIEYSFDTNGTCSYFVDFTSCECMLQTCEDGTMAPMVDCSFSYDNGTAIDLCDKTLTVDTGLFEYLSPSEFNQCIDNSPANDICSDVDAPIAVDGSLILGSTVDALDSFAESCAAPGNIGLWYNVLGEGTGIRASTCHNETDFDTQISVFSGSCDQLQCVAGNDDNFSCGASSTVEFFAEQGVMYRVFVHGYSDYIGDFGVTIEETNVATAFCEELTRQLQGDISTETTCECEENGNDAILTCRNECSYCSTDKSACTERTTVYGIKAGSPSTVESINVTHEYTQGLVGTVNLDRTGCNVDGDCLECQVAVNGEACISCLPMGYNDYGLFSYDVNCENVDTCGSGSPCLFSSDEESPPNDENGMLQLFEPDSGFDICLRDPLEVCDAFKMQLSSPFNECECSGANEAATLTCSDPTCTYCNSDYTICSTYSSGEKFDSDGQAISYFDSYQYTEGRSEVVEVDISFLDGTCSVTLDGESCNSCEFVDCPSGAYGRKVDCENLSIGAVFDPCDSTDSTDFGALQVLEYFDFTCLDVNADPEAICLDYKYDREFYSNSNTTTCECEEDTATGGYTLTCSDSDECLLCNTEGTVCATSTTAEYIDRFGQDTSQSETYNYVDGDTVTYTTSYDDWTFTCSVIVNDIPCDSCGEVICEDEYGEFYGRAVYCENVEKGASYSDCQLGYTFVDTGVLEVLSEYEFDYCVDQDANAQETCIMEKEYFESFGDVFCECVGSGLLGGYKLECMEASCIVCNDEGGVCGNYIFGYEISQFGDFYNEYDGFQYEQGYTETVVVTYDGGNQCLATVNGQECSSCEEVSCVDSDGYNYYDDDIQCDNVPGGGSYSGCSGIADGVLQYLDPYSFNDCVGDNPYDDGDDDYETN